MNTVRRTTAGLVALLRLATIVAGCCIAPPAAQSKPGDLTVGSCSIVIKDVSVTGGSIKVGDIAGCPEDPKKTLRIGYYWIDGASLSFLFQGVTKGALRDLVGDRPILIRNETYQVADDLIKRFGGREFMADSYTIEVGQPEKDRTDEKNVVSPQDLNPTLAKQFRLYIDRGQIYDFDEEIASVYLAQPGIPAGYNLYMEGGAKLPALASPRKKIDATALIEKSVLWRYVKREELASYRSRLIKARDRLLGTPSKERVFPSIHEYVEIPEKQREKIENAAGADREKYDELLSVATIEAIPSLAGSSVVQSMLHVTRTNWPDDFLMRIGYWDGHMDNLSKWETAIPGRRLYVQVAIIENIGGSGAAYKLSGFNMRRSSRIDLRTSEQDEGETKEFAPFSPARIGKGDKVLIPLRAVFRPNFEIEFGANSRDHTPSRKESARVKGLLSSAPADVILRKPMAAEEENAQGSTFVEKNARELGRAISVPTPRTYLYGPRYTLDSIVIDEVPLLARRYDPNNVVMVAGYEGGSCPMLYIGRAGGGDTLARFGTILRTAAGPNKQATEVINLGADVESIILAEEEPERTTLTDLTVTRISSSGVEEVIYQLGRTVSFSFGERFAIKLPPPDRSARYSMKVTGFYETFSTLKKPPQ